MARQLLVENRDRWLLAGIAPAAPMASMWCSNRLPPGISTSAKSTRTHGLSYMTDALPCRGIGGPVREACGMVRFTRSERDLREVEGEQRAALRVRMVAEPGGRGQVLDRFDRVPEAQVDGAGDRFACRSAQRTSRGRRRAALGVCAASFG